jgi:predicted ribosomally synthesized peptide with nif11-like leader
MNQDSVARFFESVRTDDAVAERLRAASENGDQFARLAAELGQERGFTFEPADVTEALAAIAATREGELSEQELSAVAGGTFFWVAYGAVRPPPPPPPPGGMTLGGMYSLLTCKF